MDLHHTPFLDINIADQISIVVAASVRCLKFRKLSGEEAKALDVRWNSATIHFKEELENPAGNRGLENAIKLLDNVKQEFSMLSYVDIRQGRCSEEDSGFWGFWTADRLKFDNFSKELTKNSESGFYKL